MNADASAVLRTGDGEPVPLHGTPEVTTAGCRDGEFTIILGWDDNKKPVTVTVSTLEWANDLLNTTARGIACAETPLAVRP